ncbi:MAG: HIT domain-containing protein [bacterium]|nr:HIT domain-containing protein [bacterium]
MPDCIFCKIVAGEVPSTKVYEDEEVLAFLNIAPREPQHTLVIPKEHYRWFYDMPDELSSKVFLVAKKIARELKEKTVSDFVQLSLVGKDVPHVHVHLVPRMLANAPEL